MNIISIICHRITQMHRDCCRSEAHEMLIQPINTKMIKTGGCTAIQRIHLLCTDFSTISVH